MNYKLKSRRAASADGRAMADEDVDLVVEFHLEKNEELFLTLGVDDMRELLAVLSNVLRHGYHIDATDVTFSADETSKIQNLPDPAQDEQLVPTTPRMPIDDKPVYRPNRFQRPDCS